MSVLSLILSNLSPSQAATLVVFAPVILMAGCMAVASAIHFAFFGEWM